MIDIIKATQRDFHTIQSIAHRTWPATFGDILSAEQIAYMLDLLYCTEALTEQVEERGHVFLLANENGAYVGFAAYELNYQNAGKTKIHKIYILPDHQGKGIGRMLIERVAKESEPHGIHTLSLNVNRYNPAIGMYKKLGFQIVKEEDIDIGNGFFMNDYVMEKKLLK